MAKTIHTPLGVRDIYGAECIRKNILTEKIKTCLQGFGYDFIQTPTFEYYPVFDKEKGTAHESRLFRMIDSEGHTLVLRPDFTPSIARAVSMYFQNETRPLRLCYSGSVFLNNKAYQGRLNESSEMGVELINMDNAFADAELIAMSVEIFKAAGLKDFQISVGNVGYFNEIAKNAGIDSETVSKIRHLLSIRNHFGAVELIEGLDITEEYKKILTSIPELFGDEAVLKRARELTDNSNALKAIDRLEEVYYLLKQYDISQYINWDLGMLSDYSYYTGIIFQGVTNKIGDAVIKGGRYNTFIEQFGKKADAIGFTTLVDSLLLALQRQNLSFKLEREKIMILFDEDSKEKAIKLSDRCRKNGQKAVCLFLDREIEEFIALAWEDLVSSVVVLKDKEEKEIKIG